VCRMPKTLAPWQAWLSSVTLVGGLSTTLCCFCSQGRQFFCVMPLNAMFCYVERCCVVMCCVVLCS
jgi:hypothetical protein